MRSVAKHSYLRGLKGVAKAKAHINYIQYRSGDDRADSKPREFFSQDRDHILGREVKRDIDDLGHTKVVVHKLILSPGLQGVDVEAYTRNVLNEVGRQKGLDLDWRAVTHKNTDHDHAHVVIFGKDKNGRDVLFRKEDYAKIRELGDRYLERNHFYERFLPRDTDRLMKVGYERDIGDKEFERLLGDLKRTDKAEKEPEGPENEPQSKAVKEREVREWDKEKAIEHLHEGEKIESHERVYTKFTPLEELTRFSDRLNAGQEPRLEFERYQQLWSWIGTKEKAGDDYYEREAKNKWEEKEKKRRGTGEDEREFDKLDKDLRKSFKELEGSDPFGKGHKQHLREAQGRLGADHGHYAAAMHIQQLKDLIEQFPERKEELQQQIDELRALDHDQRQVDETKWKDFDKLLGENWNVYARDKGKDQASKQVTGERQLENEQLRLEQEQQSGDQSDRDDKDRDEDAFARGET